MHIAVRILFFAFAHAAQASTDPAGHALLQGNITFNSMPGRIILDRTQHRRRSAGIDDISIQMVFPDGIHHISFCPYASVFRRNIQLSIPGKFIPQKSLFIPVSYNNLLFFTFHLLGKLQDRRHSNASAHQESTLFFCLFHREAVAKRTHKPDPVSGSKLENCSVPVSGPVTRYTTRSA